MPRSAVQNRIMVWRSAAGPRSRRLSQGAGQRALIKGRWSKGAGQKALAKRRWSMGRAPI